MNPLILLEVYMRKGMLFSLWTASLLFASCGISYADTFDKLIKQQLDAHYLPGAAIATHNQGETSLFYYGYRNLENQLPVTSNTFFEIGSITKVFTGILLASMTTDGLVQLKDPLEKYLPELAQKPAGSITLIELATHTSGLPRIPTNFQPVNVDNPYADYTEKLLLDYLSNAEIPPHPTAFSWKNYSNLGVGLLGWVLSKAAKTPYETLLKNRVLLPLGLKDTFITLNENTRPRRAQPYNSSLDAVMPWDFDALAGCGAIKTTTRDLAKFMEANLYPEKTSLSQVLLLAQKVHATNGPESIGLCWGVTASPSLGIILSHTGGTGGFCSSITILLQEKKGIITLTNSANKVQGVVKYYLTGQEGPLDLGYPVAEELLNQYPGTYQAVIDSQDMIFIIEKKYDFLTYTIPGQEKGRLLARNETTFVIGDIASLEFIKNQEGQVTHFHFIQADFQADFFKQKISQVNPPLK